ncbi:unnamed protein product [Prunus armeniaca]|uniref:Uncharacterized protein n=1 Tax=Prunus armeniaca TaxID=36596 RepID=A0A6J5WUB0_PRUAR|nr:unnamed protein product [Prunus armeniaca]CAB4303833.1 unnamed protein product [Prunus armeniaca]
MVLSEPRVAGDEKLYGDDEKYVDNEYIKELLEEAMKKLEKERNGEMAKCENKLKVWAMSK